MEVNRLQKLAGINEIKISKPGTFNKISLDTFKEIIFGGWKDIVLELFDEEAQQDAIEEFQNQIMDIKDKYDFCEKSQQFFESYGFGEEQFINVIANTMIK